MVSAGKSALPFTHSLFFLQFLPSQCQPLSGRTLGAQSAAIPAGSGGSGGNDPNWEISSLPELRTQPGPPKPPRAGAEGKQHLGQVGEGGEGKNNAGRGPGGTGGVPGAERTPRTEMIPEARGYPKSRVSTSLPLTVPSPSLTRRCRRSRSAPRGARPL